MWAIVEDNEITETFSNLKGLVIDNIQYSRNILSSRWSEAERNAIGVYTIVDDNSNRKDQEFYTNTDVSYAFADGVVTASYGSATAKELSGLKSQKKDTIKQQASELLTTTDWYIIKAVDVESYSAPANIVTHRTNIRSKSNEMESKIDSCTTIDELEALFVVTDNSRPIGDFPEVV